MRQFYVFLSCFLLTTLMSYAQPANYAWIAEFDGNYGNTRVFSNGVAGADIRSLTVQANSDNDEFVIEWDSFFNKWTNTATPLNNIFTLSFNGGGSVPNSKLSSPATNGKYYTIQIDGLDYSDRQAVIMETTGAPIGFSGIAQQSPSDNVTPELAVVVESELSANRNPELKVFVRYSDDGFSTSTVVDLSTSNEVDFLGAIPGTFNTIGKTVEYYFFTTTVDATTISDETEYDLVSIDILNNSGSNYSYTIGKTTAAAGAWENNATWMSGSVPASGDVIVINHNVSINSDVEQTSDFLVSASNVLSISPGHSLKFTGSTFTNNGGVLMTSSSSTFSSFIPSTSSTLDGTGGYEYERHTNSNTNGNDLISPPLSNDTFGAFATRNNANLFSDSGNANIKLFGPFTTSATAPEYIEYVVGTDDDSESLISGKGYRGASVSGNNLAYQGSVLKDDVSASIINNGETDFKSWNLVGNPFSSYVQLGIDLLNSTTINSLDTNYQSFYFYNAGTSGSYPGATTQGNWTIVNVSYVLSNEDTAIAPGQGFFVKAKSGSGSVLFEESSRFTATDAASSDDGIAGRNTTTTSNIARAKIGLSTANNTSEIDIYFLDDATLGLDPGYDVGGFGGSSFGIFTNLLNGDTGVQMAIQSLPYSSLNSVSIPLGINMDAGTQFTLELNDVYSLLPDGIDLYLDDTLENTSTLLNSGDYVLTPVTSLSGTGRFYLRFSNNALTTTEQRLDHVTVYTNQSTKTINISGQLDAGTIAMVYDIQGREIITQKLSSESILQRIDSDDLHTGVYIVKLYTKTKSKSVKLIIR